MKDKIIFWIDSSLFYFGIAKYIQEKHDCELYAVIDITDRQKKFFQSQNLVEFEKVWFYHDNISKTREKPDLEYLESIEKKYKINLWLLARNERIFYDFNDYYKFSDNEVLSILEQECRLFEHIIDEVKPDFLIINQPAFHHNHLFYKMCKAKGIKILMLRTTRIGYKCILTDEDELLDYKEDVSYDDNKTFEELRNYLSKYNIYAQNVKFEQRFLKSKSGLLKSAFQFLFVSNNSNVKTHYTYYGRTKFRVLIKSILYSLRTKYRKNFIDRNLPRQVNNTKPFIYFPMHIEQERSLLIIAPFYTNQLEVIKNIVKSLPVGYDLFIKEHPGMSARGWHSISYYKEISSMPNVHLIHPSVKPEEIIEKCSLVITISGTASFDAVCYKKPSIVFVDTSFSMLPSVYRLKTIEELPYAIRSSLQTEVKVSDLNKYVNFINGISFTFDHDGFVQDHHDFFHHGGFLMDVDIPIQKMKLFLEERSSEFSKLAVEHIEKINQYTESKSGT